MTTASILAALLALHAPIGLQDAPGPAADTGVVSFGGHLTWAVGEGPAGREHGAFFVDPARPRAVLLAGSGYEPYGSPLGDAWTFDLATSTWSELKLMGAALTPGGGRRTAVVRGSGRKPASVYLHGGYAEGMQEIDTLWRAELRDDAVVLTELEQVNAPVARLLHGFAASPSGDTLVLFGGIGGDDGLADTWIGRVAGDRVTWRELVLETNPGKRFGFSFAFDEARGRFLVCSGQVPPKEDEEPRMIVAEDLWSLDFTAEAPKWTCLATYSSAEFHGRRNPAFTFDEASGDLFVWGGTGDGATALTDLYVVHTRDEGAPVKRLAQPEGVPTRASGFGVVDAARGRALLGFGNDASGPKLDLIEIRLRGGAGQE